MYNSKKLENPDRNEIGQTANLTNQLSREDHKPRPKSGLALAIPHWVKQKNFTRSLRLPKSYGRVSQSLWFVAISLQISIIHQNILRSLTCLYAHFFVLKSPTSTRKDVANPRPGPNRLGGPAFWHLGNVSKSMTLKSILNPSSRLAKSKQSTIAPHRALQCSMPPRKILFGGLPKFERRPFARKISR